jgi:hypothetical protein
VAQLIPGMNSGTYVGTCLRKFTNGIADELRRCLGH